VCTCVYYTHTHTHTHTQDKLVHALKSGEKTAAGGDASAPSSAVAIGSKGAKESKEFKESSQAKLSAAQSRKDLNKFFDEMSRPEDVRAHQHDVGDKYDRHKL
jgi:calcineurin-like phosphoesterase